MKRLILVAAPPASGKSYVARQLARALKPVVYLDKDTLTILSKQIFAAANEPYNRSSDFFEQNVRNYEYDTILALAKDALRYNNTVLVNAPFTREVRNPKYVKELREQLFDYHIALTIIWVVADPEVCHKRMLGRNSDRDSWKLAHWDEYIASCDFSIPEGLDNPKDKRDFILFYNSNEKEFKTSIKETLALIGKKRYERR